VPDDAKNAGTGYISRFLPYVSPKTSSASVFQTYKFNVIFVLFHHWLDWGDNFMIR
jgi:hypothetical protein